MRRVVVAVAVVLVTSCGRIGFDELDPGDGPPPAPALVDSVVIDAAKAPQISLPVSVPDMQGRYLIVSIGIGALCAGSDASITAVTFDGSPMTSTRSIVGTPCDASSTRSEHFDLRAPAPGPGTVVIDIAGMGLTIHASAMVFVGIDQSTPVRSDDATSGRDMTTNRSIASAPGDLVVSTVGHGTSVVGPTQGSVLFVHNVSNGSTLDNSAASTAPGAELVTMGWTFGGTDDWQMINVSLRAAQ